jgi:hypothetical protein
MLSNMKIKCNECDNRGYIVDTPFPNYSGHSCKCGWAIQESMKKFDNVSIEELLNYAQKRIGEKKNLGASILGSITSKKKSKSSKKNGKLGGRPKNKSLSA